MARYIIADPSIGGGWSHLFEEAATDMSAAAVRERTARFVYDTEAGSLIHLDIDRNGLQPATSVETADLEDSLKNANTEALETPADWGLTATDVLPSWCSEPAAAPKP